MARESQAQCSTRYGRASRCLVDASIGVEVFIRAFDRFGGKIAVMIVWDAG